MPKDKDFLAGRNKCQEEENAIEFLICPLTLGENGPTAHKAVVIIGNTAHKGARQQLKTIIFCVRQNY